MAAMSAVSGTTTLTPPSSSHADHSGWKQTSASHHNNSMSHKLPTSRHETNGPIKGMSSFQNGDSDYDPYASNSSFSKDQRTSQTNSTSDHKRSNADISPSERNNDDEHSKWIHRDKLARIENQELQAAGIILPKPRARSRPGRDPSRDKANGHRRGTDASEHQPTSRSRKNSELSVDKTPDLETPSWDLRLPEEIAEDPGEYFILNGTGKSRIPVAKQSPAPIPVDFLDRDAPVRRQPSYPLLDEDASISLPKPRSRSGSSNVLDTPKMQAAKRSVTEGSPKKGATTGGAGARKASAPAKTATTPGRPKTRSGPTPRSNSTTRPSTRSGELSPSSKAAPEGDPPWMISAYKPDPRLPPDQQLLPTVAKRLQQEKWEQEGKFGNIYDKEFRPLNDEGFLRPPELEKPKDAEEGQDEWPLRAGTKSPNMTNRPGTSSYSTMPRIPDTPASNTIPSPRTPQQPQMQAAYSPGIPPQEEQTEEKPKKSGCGCCIVM
ncbi:hypothetical protein GGR52DRAFT_175616 [Hypoxylon sp. FL1284]|nr:hypothetical protein GGR52DRAFT_175616 [Hypoxylon sp. FL1284]